MANANIRNWKCLVSVYSCTRIHGYVCEYLDSNSLRSSIYSLVHVFAGLQGMMIVGNEFVQTSKDEWKPERPVMPERLVDECTPERLVDMLLIIEFLLVTDLMVSPYLRSLEWSQLVYYIYDQIKCFFFFVVSFARNLY